MDCLYVVTVLEVSYLQPRHLPYQMVGLDLLLLPLSSGYQLDKDQCPVQLHATLEQCHDYLHIHVLWTRKILGVGQVLG